MFDYEGHSFLRQWENIFNIEDGVLYNSSMDSTLKELQGNLLNNQPMIEAEVVEERISRERLYFVDEVFFSGTAAEVTPIRSIDHKIIGAGKRGPISEELQKLSLTLLKAKEDKFGWLDYV